MTVKPVGRARAEREASALLSRLNMVKPPIDPYRIAEVEGISVSPERLPRDTSSILLRDPSGLRIICVNTAHSETRKRFSVAHELGHAVLHFGNRPPSVGEAAVSRPLEVLFRDGLAGTGTDRVEIDANTFAAALLMPSELTTETFIERLQRSPNTRTDRLVKEMAIDFGVSEQAMSYRLINLGVIDPA